MISWLVDTFRRMGLWGWVELALFTTFVLPVMVMWVFSIYLGSKER